MKYKITKLKDIAEISMGQSPSSKYYNKTKKGIPFLQGVSTFGEMFPQINTYTTVYRKEAKSGDILFSVRAPVGKVNFANQKTAIGRGLATIRVKKTYSKFYIYYFLKKNGRLLDFLSSGTVFTSINKKDLEEIRLKIPNRLNDQQQIAEKLLKIDKKIDINNQINDNLLELLDTEFHHQFSHKTHFRRAKIRDYVKITRGSSPRPIKNFLTTFGRPWIKISDISNLSSPYLYKTKQYISKSGISKSKTVLPGTLILSNSATPGIPVISKIVASVHDGWLIISDYKLMNRNWFYLFFRQKRQELLKRANGSVFNNLKISIVENFPINAPNKDLLKRFEKISNPIFSDMEELQLENIKLTKIKEALLNLYF